MTPDNSGAEGPYAALLRNVPDALKDPLKKAADAQAAIAWLKDGATPDPGAPDGLDSQREYLRATGTDPDGDRWVDWKTNRRGRGGDERLTEADERLAEALASEPDVPADTPDGYAADRYGNDQLDIDEFIVETAIEFEGQGIRPGLPDRLSFRDQMALPISIPKDSEIELEGDLPRGSYVAVVEYAPANGTTSYQGLYRLSKACLDDDPPETPPNGRVWLNAAAERVLEKALR